MRQLLARTAIIAILLMQTGTQVSGFGGEDVKEGLPWHHVDITERGLVKNKRYDGAGFSKSAAMTLAWHADYIDSYLYNPLFWAEGIVLGQNLDRLDAALAGYENLAKLHFDDTFSTSGLRGNWERYAAGTLAGLYWASIQGPSGDLAAGQNILGVSFHAVQDFYSHSSWVDDPDRRCKTWFQVAPEARNSLSIYSGAYELPASGAPKHHGAYSLSCSLLRGETIDQVLDPVCTGYSPFQNTSLCEEWRLCAGGSAVTMSVYGNSRDDIVYLQPPGIALDTTWLSRVQAPNRGLIDQDGNFAPRKDGMYFPEKDCREIVNVKDREVCEADADQVFAGAKDLAIRATAEWADYLEEAMNAMGPRQKFFWGRLKREGSTEEVNARQFEDFSKLPYQFLAAGPYPTGNPSTLDREIAGTSNGWYLRVRLKTSNRTDAGTDSDIYARVQVGGAEQSHRLDYLPTDDNRGRTSNRLLVYDDFEEGDDAVYVLGPFGDQPRSISFYNDSSTGGEVFQAIWNDFTTGIEEALTSARRGLLSLIAGNADYVGTTINHYTAADIGSKIDAARAQTRFFEGVLHVDGGDEGIHDIIYRMRHVPSALSRKERNQQWQAIEVQLHKLKTIQESDVDRGSTSDEPFVIFHVAPLNGIEDSAHTYLSPQLEDMDDGDEYVFPRRTGSAVIVKIPPEGGLVVSAQVYESDSESGFDREQLMRTFASGFDEETRAPAGEFADALGRLLGADWEADFVEVFAFERGAIPSAGPILRRHRIGAVPGDTQSAVYEFNWSKVRPLLAAEQTISAWEADPVEADILNGKWHVRGEDCDGPVAYDSVNVDAKDATLQAIKTTGTPCVGVDEVSWKGEFRDGVIEGELWTSPPPKDPETLIEETEPEPEPFPNFLDTSIDPMIELEGNWIIEWENAEDTQPALAVLSKGAGRGCVSKNDGCWYAFTRDPDADWKVSFWMPPNTGSGGSVSVSPDGAISASYSYYHLGYWGGKSTGVASKDEITGEWTYSDKKGREIWRRVRGRVTEAEAVNGAIVERYPLSRPVTVTAPFVDHPFDLRGNRPTVYLTLYGDDLWGIHYYWMPRETDLEISGLRYICEYDGENGYPSHPNYHVCMRQGGVRGVQLAINVWHDARPGEQTLYFNDQEIKFNLEITGYPAPAPKPEPGWRPLKLEMTSCSVLQEVEAPENVSPLVLSRWDFRR